MHNVNIFSPCLTKERRSKYRNALSAMTSVSFRAKAIREQRKDDGFLKKPSGGFAKECFVLCFFRERENFLSLFRHSGSSDQV